MDRFEEDTVKVPFGRKHLDAVLCVPASVTDVHTAVILTHGAGGDMNFKHLVSLAHALASGGFLCLRFTCKGLNLAYRVKAYRAVWDYLKTLERFNINQIYVGGRSMGCRAAAALARQLVDQMDDLLEGVICLSFPLHPPGQTNAHKQRSEDLRGLPEHVSVLFLSGTEDNMCDRMLFAEMVKEVKAKVDVFWLQGGSHGLTVKGRSEESVLQEAELFHRFLQDMFDNYTTRFISDEGLIGVMAGEPWNRVNIPFPGAVSSVRIHFSKKTGANVEALLVENKKVLKIIHSELLQTEVRVLYELLYNLKNSFRGNKTFKCLQQVEQCINRLKNMKLDVALQDLTDLCPDEIQRGVSLKTGDCGVPSQPMLEWLSLKLLGAAQLMSCTLTRCSRAFIFTKQQLNLEEFVVLNMVIIGMLSRLWVIFRGILISLSPLYKQLLVLLREVAHAQPMPYLTDFSLPADMTQFLHPSDILYLKKQSKWDSRAKSSKETTVNQGHSLRMKEDLGVALKRDVVFDAGTKPLLEVFRDLREPPKGKDSSQETEKADEKKQKFRKQLRDATTFTDMAKHLEEMILWCKSENMGKEKCFLTFLRLKCHKLKSLEAAGYNLQRKLQTFRREACWASSPQGSMPKTCCFSAAVRRNAHLRTRLHSLRSQFKSSLLKQKSLKRRRRRTQFSVSEVSEDAQRSRTTREPSPWLPESDSHDDIDDIFSSVGL